MAIENGVGSHRAARTVTGLPGLALAACDTVTWMALLNVAWLIGTALGGVVLGAGPATAAAHALSRDRLRGDGARFAHDFCAIYRREWRRANAVFAPIVVVVISLAFTSAWAIDARAPWLVGVALTCAAAFVVALCGVLAPMYAHYDLPWNRYVLVASRFVVVTPWAGALVAGLAGVVALASALVPALPVFVAIGAWIHLDAVLAQALFAANDRRLAAAAAASTDI